MNLKHIWEGYSSSCQIGWLARPISLLGRYAEAEPIHQVGDGPVCRMCLVSQPKKKRKEKR